MAFTRKGAKMLAQNMLEKGIQFFRFGRTSLHGNGQRIKLNGGGAAIWTAKS